MAVIIGGFGSSHTPLFKFPSEMEELEMPVWKVSLKRRRPSLHCVFATALIVETRWFFGDEFEVVALDFGRGKSEPTASLSDIHDVQPIGIVRPWPARHQGTWATRYDYALGGVKGGHPP
jgi:hypothetical protein